MTGYRFLNDDDRRQYERSERDKFVRPGIVAFKNIVVNYTLADLSRHVDTTLQTYSKGTHPLNWAGWPDCPFCRHFYLNCAICPVDYWSIRVWKTGNRACEWIGDRMRDGILATKIVNQEALDHLSLFQRTVPNRSFLENWRKAALDILNGARDGF